jgi:hypothetical protein
MNQNAICAALAAATILAAGGNTAMGEASTRERMIGT